jgi:molecular chaperone HtpG
MALFLIATMERHMQFSSTIEKKAAEANSFDAFVQCNLPGIKDSVTSLLELIGRDGIFGEYTKHDISHVNKLLEMSDWLIPPATLQKLTVADSLMITLAIYFHDLGMLVTREEFDRRGESDFPAFKQKVFEGGGGEDYSEKVRKMPRQEAERFLYQEFVREIHAQRIRSWVAGKNVRALGINTTVPSELEKLLEGLGDKFRKDLGLVCESHHLYDLENLEKYKPSQPYGSNHQESANLQYAALILRTADLLHVTKDRAPSLTFRVVNPADPKSIEEWQKQMTVVAVRSKPGLDKDENVDPNAPRDTVEVFGLFKQPEGFFALTAYLNYARKELRRCNDWAQTAKKKKGATADFPWREIDEAGLEAEGFIDKQFEFTLDQAKILDLLTGHTLYNDTTVVLRELVQNSLDAIRVEWEAETNHITEGEVRITWDSSERVLTVEDNGTGMTQDAIDRHFLKVGSSLYQDDDFRKNHPTFSAISRFGIGVLSTFMISDEIEVTTCSPDDEQARVLSLRSLHGKYLVRLLDKDSPTLPKHISSHGTQIRLRVRPSADLKNLVAVLERWIVFPRCKVSAAVDGAPPVEIGFLEPKDALKSVLTSLGRLKPSGTSDEDHVKIEQRTHRGVTLAYALEWSPYFKEWTFLIHRPSQRDDAPTIGTCIEGIRVGFSSPGFSTYSILAVANSVGPDAPKTNVARSGLEMTPERERLLRSTYDLYCGHVAAEVDSLHKTRGVSLTSALAEATWLMRPLFERSRAVEDDALEPGILLDAAADIPCISLEAAGSRLGVSPDQLSVYAFFWTVDSAFFASAESLIKEIPKSVAISRLAEVIGEDSLQLPEGPFISLPGLRSILDKLVFRNREVDRIVVNAQLRRVDLRWRNVGDLPIWRDALPGTRDLKNAIQAMMGTRRQQPMEEGIYLAQGSPELVGAEGKTAVKSLGRIFVLPGPLCSYLLSLLARIEHSFDQRKSATYAIALGALFVRIPVTDVEDYLRREVMRINRETPFGHLPVEGDSELIEVLTSADLPTFDPRAWSRGIEYQ